MTVTIEIPKEIEARLSAEAQASGRPLRDFVRDMLIEYYEESDDRATAESRLANPQQPITGRQLRNDLGLDS